MPVAEVQFPDGRIGQFDVPEGTTPDQVMAFAQSQIQTQSPQDQNPIMQTLMNVPGSAANFLGGTARAVMHPLQTGMGLMDMAAGGLHNLLPQSITGAIDQAAPSPNTQRAVNTANAVGQFYKQRYGGISNIGNTIVQDPIGAMADVSAVAGLGSGALRVAGMPGAADAAMTASRWTNPLYLGGKAVSSVASPIWQQLMGQTTASGPEAIGEAMKGTQTYINAMRGTTSEEDVLKSAQDSFQAMKDARAAQYQSQLQNLKNANVDLDIAPIQSKAGNWLSQYNIRVNPDGELNFSRSTLAPGSTGAKEVADIYNTVMDWGTKEGDTSPYMLDILKRRLSDFAASERPSRAMATSLSNATKSMIVEAVPQYEQMQAGYAQASDLINQVQKALSLGQGAPMDTALRKLMISVKEDPAFRRSLITSLDQGADKNVMAGVAGLLNKNVTTGRFFPKMAAGAAGGAAMIAHPGMAALIPLASPRIVGELSLLLGQFGRAAPAAATPALFAYQAGRLPTGDNNGNQ